MGDFSAPTEISPDSLPPSPTNFISPNKRPLSSMTPVIIVKGDQLVGVIGGSGGMYIIPAVIQVFLNHFILGMEPLDAVQSPRVYHKGFFSFNRGCCLFVGSIPPLGIDLLLVVYWKLYLLVGVIMVNLAGTI
ncbi:Gamma-glutamyltranspeptidase [Artemisia annua]|uniref:Gamma-glutamyltranspeptidase n=1 Tax=Artemisia annua TaxID=35608 RepID=A0A2U1M6A9_ARTAN|nr:Gamma-glutamyltranspeptidase [Artemisia annua]